MFQHAMLIYELYQILYQQQDLQDVEFNGIICGLSKPASEADLLEQSVQIWEKLNGSKKKKLSSLSYFSIPTPS